MTVGNAGCACRRKGPPPFLSSEEETARFSADVSNHFFSFWRTEFWGVFASPFHAFARASATPLLLRGVFCQALFATGGHTLWVQAVPTLYPHESPERLTNKEDLSLTALVQGNAVGTAPTAAFLSYRIRLRILTHRGVPSVRQRKMWGGAIGMAIGRGMVHMSLCHSELP